MIVPIIDPEWDEIPFGLLESYEKQLRDLELENEHD